MGRFRDFLFNNAYAMDSEKVESELNEKFPHLLNANEHIELAFTDRGGKGRDSKYFTTHRILIRDGKGIGNKRKEFTTIPYDAITAFSIETAGAVLDADTELHVYSRGIPKKSMDFSKENVDIFSIYQLLNTKIPWGGIRGTPEDFDPTPPNMDKKQSTVGNMIDWLGDNAMQVDSAEMEEHFKTEFPILLKDEKVEIAFKSGRDSKCFTNNRILLVNVKGITGKRIEFLTLPYYTIQGFSVQTAGALDRDMELVLFTNMVDHLYKVEQDFRAGKANLWAIQTVLCNHVLGDDKDPLPDVDQYQGDFQSNAGLFGLITGAMFDQRPVDPAAMNEALHSDPPILQGSETVEIAFQGHRDITLFTTKRVVTIDKKGLLGKRVEYFSIPWEKLMAFGIRSAGKFIDFDTEVQLYTEMGFYAGEAGKPGTDNSPPVPPIPPRPEQSCFELDFSKDKVDLFKLKYYLSKRIMDITSLEQGAPIPLDSLTSASPDPKGFERLFQWLGSDQRELDPKELDVEFHTNCPILLDDEKCLMAFKGGRDVSMFTNLRILTMDVQGLVGCKVEYTSIPYRNIHAFSVRSAGMWDRDSELDIFTRNRWHLSTLSMDFRSGKTDIMMIQKFLSAVIVGLPSDAKLVFDKPNYEAHEKNAVGMHSLAAGFFDNSKEIDTTELNTKLHTDIPLLLPEETILRGFAQARDTFLYTNRRFISIDTQGLTGQRTEYKSVPYKYIDGFAFETAGHMDRDAEIYTYSSIAKLLASGPPRRVGILNTKHSILVKNTDIFEIGKLFADHTIFDEIPSGDQEPEIEFTF